MGGYVNEISNTGPPFWNDQISFIIKVGEYVSEILQETVLTLKDANSKTNYKHVAASFAFGMLFGAILVGVIKILTDDDD